MSAIYQLLFVQGIAEMPRSQDQITNESKEK